MDNYLVTIPDRIVDPNTGRLIAEPGQYPLTDPRISPLRSLAWTCSEDWFRTAVASMSIDPVAQGDLVVRCPAPEPRAFGHPVGASVAGLGHGRYTAKPHWRRRTGGRKAQAQRGNGDHRHCPACGAWLTGSGGCNRCREV